MPTYPSNEYFIGRLFAYYVLTFLIIAMRPPLVSAYLTEEFNSTITSPTLWNSVRFAGIQFDFEGEKQYVRFAYDSTLSFPYMGSRDLSSEQISSLEVYARLHSGFTPLAQGAGIILSDVEPPFNVFPNFSEYLFYIWPKPDGSFHLFTTLCPDENLSCSIPFQLSNGVYNFVEGVWMNIKVNYLDSQYIVSVDNTVIFQTESTDRKINYIALGHPEEAAKTTLWPHFDIDKIIINNDQGNISYYSQTDPEWAGEEYDNASEWAGEESNGIDRWGCALTSSAMLFNYHDVEIGDDGCQEINPSNLNSWLISQDDGYIRNGLVNWIALSRLSRISYENSCSPTKLEFSRSSFSPVETYDTPNILGLSGHFVVGSSQDDDGFQVLDPADEQNTAIDDSEVLTVNNFTPSETDLSYMMVVGDEGLDILLEHEGVGVNAISELPIIDDVGGEQQSGDTVEMAMWPKPSTGQYLLKVFNDNDHDEKYVLNFYLYDIDGNVKRVDVSRDLDIGGVSWIIVDFDKELIENSIVLDGFRELVWWFYGNGDITSLNVAGHLDSFSRIVEKFGDKESTQVKLEKALDRYIDAMSPRFINSQASAILKDYEF